jgi:predicted Zn-dependent protease
MEMRNSARIAGLVLPLLLTAASCATTGINAGQLNLISTEEEIRLGLHYMFGAGYSPNAMTSFQKKLGKLQSENPSRALNLLSTHPLSQDRMEAIREEISKSPPGRPVYYYSERYKRIVGRALR